MLLSLPPAINVMGSLEGELRRSLNMPFMRVIYFNYTHFPFKEAVRKINLTKFKVVH